MEPSLSAGTEQPQSWSVTELCGQLQPRASFHQQSIHDTQGVAEMAAVWGPGDPPGLCSPLLLKGAALNRFSTSGIREIRCYNALPWHFQLKVL